MKKSVSLMTRIPGEASLALLRSANGAVKEAVLRALLPVRAFESFVKGKSPVFAIEGIKRICGVCHAVQGIAAARAFEGALGLAVPTPARQLRTLCSILNREQSHTLAQLLLAEDLLVDAKATKAKACLMNLHELFCKAMVLTGGKATHPPNIALGGVLNGLSDEKRESLDETLGEAGTAIDAYSNMMSDESAVSDARRFLRGTPAPDVEFLSCGTVEGQTEQADLSKVTTGPRAAYARQLEEEGKKDTGLIATYAGNVVETGPRARLSSRCGWQDQSLDGVNNARIEEIRMGLTACRDLLARMESAETGGAGPIVIAGKRCSGTATEEAPRGTLIHSLVLGETGKVESYTMVIPTMFNIPVIERAIQGKPAEYAKTIVRVYDPCIPCEVH